MVETNNISIEQIWTLLEAVKDPEIPVLSLVDLGMITGVAFVEEHVEIKMAPTFTGCPALAYMQKQIKNQIEKNTGIPTEVIIDKETQWTSDNISIAGKEKLKKFGIAPPMKKACGISMQSLKYVPCPYCNSADTVLRSTFGSTLCRAMHYCNSCKQSFEQFKPI